MWQWKAWRKFVRKNTSPIPEERAAFWKQRLSLGYMFLAWNAFGLVLYSVFTGKSDWRKYYGYKSEEEIEMRPGEAWAKTLGIQKAKVYTIDGLKIVDEYEVKEQENNK